MPVPRPLPDGRNRGQRPASHPRANGSWTRPGPGNSAARKEHRNDQTPGSSAHRTDPWRPASRPGRLANPAAPPEAETHLALFIRAMPIPILGGADVHTHSTHDQAAAGRDRRRCCAVALLAGAGPAAAQARSPASFRGAASGGWGTAQPVPGLAALNTGGLGQVNSVACTSAGNCTAVGELRHPHHDRPVVRRYPGQRHLAQRRENPRRRRTA